MHPFIRTFFIAAATISSSSALSSVAPNSKKNIAVFGGTGFVGSAVCERLVKRGYQVTAVSRRGVNPRPGSPELDQVNWVSGDATDPRTVNQIVSDADGVVHAVGLLFDVNSGLTKLNTVVSGSGSLPGDDSTYDNITRKTMFNVIDAIGKKRNVFTKEKFPLAFVSCAEAGWPDVALGSTVENKLAPGWLKEYLVAKRAVESRLESSSDTIRSVIVRPSLIWDWKKLDVLPIIPIFNLASAVGVPFVDKTVRVETLADAIVAGIEDESVEGVQRFMQMEELSKKFENM